MIFYVHGLGGVTHFGGAPMLLYSHDKGSESDLYNGRERDRERETEKQRKLLLTQPVGNESICVLFPSLL